MQRRLERGAWIEWIEDELPFAIRSAQSYLALATWADAHRDDYQRLRHLGPSKLYLLVGLESSHLRKLVVRRPVEG